MQLLGNSLWGGVANEVANSRWQQKIKQRKQRNALHIQPHPHAFIVIEIISLSCSNRPITHLLPQLSCRFSNTLPVPAAAAAATSTASAAATSATSAAAGAGETSRADQ